MMTTQNPKKVALVLSGGGLKAAAYHCGVCLALEKAGYSFKSGSKADYSNSSMSSQSEPPLSTHRDYSQTTQNLTIQLFVGSSAGAMVAGLLTSGYSPSQLIKAFIRDYSKAGSQDTELDLDPISPRKIFSLNKRGLISGLPKSLVKGASFRTNIEGWFKDAFAFSGLFTTRRIEEYLRKQALTVNRFQDLSPELFVVTSELNRSQKIIFGPKDLDLSASGYRYESFASLSQAIAGSIAIPPIFAPYSVKDAQGQELWLYDGEIRDTLSLHVATDQGADRVICSYTIKPYEYTPEIGSLHSFGSGTIANQALYQLIQQKIERSLKSQEDLRQIYLRLTQELSSRGLLNEDLKETIKELFVSFGAPIDSQLIMIHPEGPEMFFYDHFPFDSKVLEKIVECGTKDAELALAKFSV